MKKKIIAAFAMVLIVAMAIVGTYAYLTDKTATVTNTFTVGKVDIELDEAKVDEYGVALTGNDAARVTANTYKLIPGHSYTKDPIVYVKKGSEACWVFVEIVDQISTIEDTDTIATQITSTTNGWTALGDSYPGVYYKEQAAVASDATADVQLPVFSTFKIKGDADVSAYAGKTITVTAYAIQKDGFADNVTTAWTTVKAASTS